MLKFKLLIKLLAIITIIASSKAAYGLEDYKIDQEALEKWQKFNDVLKKGVKSLTKSVLPYAMRITSGLNLSTSCVRDGLHVFNGIRKLDPIAARFIDSSGKMIDGIVAGTISATGAFDECLETEVFNRIKDGKSSMLYRGQYCTMKLKPPLPKENKVLTTSKAVEGFENFTESETLIPDSDKLSEVLNLFDLRFGICVPSGCTKDDINQIVHAIGNSVYIEANITHCEVKEPHKYSPATITVLFICSGTVFLVLVGSLLDINRKKSAGTGLLLRCLSQFSLFKNCSKLIKVDHQNEHLRCLNGIRFIALCWITLAHTYSLVNAYSLKHAARSLDMIQEFAFQAVVNAFHITDTFFVIGGAVSCYVVITYVRTKGRPFNIPMYILNRLARILPVYIYLLLAMFWWPLLRSGPFWNEVMGRHIQNCYDKWWYNILFVNNYLDAESMCLHHTWYLAIDFQFYIAAIFILLPLIKRPKLGVLFCVFTIISSVILCGFLAYFGDYQPTVILNGSNFLKKANYLNHYYFKPYPHIAPYVIGLLLGYVLALKRTFRVPKRIQLLCWVLAFVASFSVSYGSVGWNRGRDPTMAETISYTSLSKMAWALSVAWIIFACATRHGGFINRFLSWKGFVPLGRLTFMAYLLHPLIIETYYSWLETKIQVSHFYGIWLYLGHLSITFIIAFAASMCVEAPFISLMKMLLSREKGTNGSDSANTMKTFPVQNLYASCDEKLGIERKNDTNGHENKCYTEESPSNGIITKGCENECKEYKITLSELISQNNFHNNVSSHEENELEDVKVDDNQKPADETETHEKVSKIIEEQQDKEEDRKSGDVPRNDIGDVKNPNEICRTQKETQVIDTDVKATFFPGLGWKLLNFVG